MINTCIKCGQYSAAKVITDIGPYALCPYCGYNQQFKRLPLFVLTGASGAGKSTMGLKVSECSDEVIALDVDLFWSDQYNTPENDYREFREHSLRVAKNISQCGKPVLLCGSAIPRQYEHCIEKRYFSNIYYIALVCDDETLKQRLKDRPAYRNCGSDEFITQHINFNNWFKENYDKFDPPIKLIDNSNLTEEQAAKEILDWISCIL